MKETIRKQKIWRGPSKTLQNHRKTMRNHGKTIRKPKIQRGQTTQINQKHCKTTGKQCKTIGNRNGIQRESKRNPHETQWKSKGNLKEIRRTSIAIGEPS